MKVAVQCAVIVGLLSTTAIVNAASWSGHYEYGEDAGQTAGGTPIFIVHDLKIWKGKNGFEARLESNGYQTYSNLICTAKPTGNSLNVYFKKAAMKEMYFAGQRGDLMFRLERTDRRGNRGLTTIWKKFTPVALEKYPARGVAFIRKTTKREG